MKTFQFFQNRIMCILLIVLLMISTALFPVLPAAEQVTATPPTEQTATQEDGATEETKKKMEELEKAKKEYEEKEKLYKQANESVNKINAQIETLENEIITTVTAIQKLEAQIKAKWLEIDAMYNGFKGRLKAIYMSGSYTNLQALLTSESFSDYLTRAEMIRVVSKKDAEAIQQMQRAYAVLKKKQAKVEVARTKLEDKEADLQTNKASLEEKKAEAAKAYNASLEQLQKVDEATEATQLQIEQEQKELKEIVSMCQKEAAISKEIAAAIKSGAYDDIESEIVSNGGSLCFPVPSCTDVSCGFYGYTNHNGMDFSNMKVNGQKVVAAQSGKIMSVKLLDYSYGHHVWINHGRNVATLYAHMSRIVVKEGQYVKKGQVIGYVGSTGNSTGPHLHFGLLIQGKFVNPLNYF